MRFPERAPAQNTFQGITLLVQIAGLVGTGWLMWSRSVLPRLAFETPDRLIVQAFGYALLACGASISITAILYLALVRSWNNEVLPLALRTSATAIWFGPATNIGPLPAALLVCLSVSLFTLLLLLAGLASVRAGGPFASARGVLRYFFRPERRRAPQSTVYLQPPPKNDGNIPNIGYPGVILRPEVEPRTTLVAPPPTWIRKPGPPNAALPAEIPFPANTGCSGRRTCVRLNDRTFAG